MKLEEINNRTKEATDYLVASLEAGHSEVLTQYLGAMAKFHTYSFGNVMLIARQKPSATNVAGVRTWNSLGRFVRRGEKGILILAPMVGRKRQPVEEITAENGEEKNPQSQLYGFRAVHVFDISQTEGKDLPAFPKTIRRAKLEPSLEIGVPELVPLFVLPLCPLTHWTCTKKE